MDSNSPKSLYKFDVVHINIRGVLANNDNLAEYLQELNYPEIITLNETKLAPEKRVTVNNYECVSRRETHRSYGSMILVRSDIGNVVEINNIKTRFMNDEIIGIEILETALHPGLKVFTMYNPPNKVPNADIFRYISNLSGKVILSGDFNCKNLSWGSTKTDRLGEDLQDLINENDLYILNDSSKTRCDPFSGKEEALDLILCNHENLSLFRGFWVGPPIGSDHFPIHSRQQFRSDPNPTSREKERRIESTDWKKFEQILNSSTSLAAPKTPTEADLVAENLTREITKAFQDSCPLQYKRQPYRTAFTPEIKAMVKEKRKLRRLKNAAMERNDITHVRHIMTKINRLGNDIKGLQKLERKHQLEKHCEQLSREVNPKKFFQTFKKVANPIINSEPTPSSFQIISDEFGNEAKTDQEKSDLFANRLEKVHQEPSYRGFNAEWKKSVDDHTTNNPGTFLVDPHSEYAVPEDGDDSPLLGEVTTQEIRYNLAKCKTKSAVGLDGISYGLLKKLPETYLKKIAGFLTICLRLGHFPSSWKHAKTILIPKPGKDSKQAKNHRPISLLSCLGKILERILADRLSKHLEQNNLFAKSQSGFRAKRMTTEQLLRLSEECHNAFKTQKVTAALFLDAEAAFDKCWHNGIRYKLRKNLKLPNRFIRIISSFLTDRTLQVFYRGCWSRKVGLQAGTPQGSPLSPLIYLIFVNDLPQEIVDLGLSLSQYADDTALWTAAYTVAFGISKLQKGLNFLEGWCRRWRVKLNGDKSKLLIISRLREKTSETPCLQLFDDIIKPVPTARFLGVEFDSRLNFAPHIQDINGRANKRLNVLRVLSRGGATPSTLTKLYGMYIRPLFEYGSAAFLAAPKNQLEKIQKTQNEAIRVSLRLPSYIRINLMHEAASMPKLQDRLTDLNKKLLLTIKQNNEHIEHLASDRSANSISPNIISPLDILL